ncbi:MAG: MotE family protein [Thermodesulfobacteriota bacterium]
MSATMKCLLSILVLVKAVLVIQLAPDVTDIAGRLWGDPPAFGEEGQKSAKTLGKAEEKTAGDTGTETEAPMPDSVSAVPEKTTAADEVKITLESLEQKRLEIQAAETRLAEERAKLETLKQEIAAEIESLARKNQELEEKLGAVESKDASTARSQQEAEEKKLKQLVKVYSNMKPKEAAPIIDKLDIEVAEKIFLRMKGELAGQILAYVNEDRAARISERLAAENKKQKKTP